MKSMLGSAVFIIITYIIRCDIYHYNTHQRRVIFITYRKGASAPVTSTTATPPHSPRAVPLAVPPEGVLHASCPLNKTKSGITMIEVG